MSKQDKKANELAIPGVVQGIELVNVELKKLKSISESVYKTPGRITGFPNSLQNETSISELIKMFSSVQARETAYDNAQTLLAIDSAPVFKVDGGTAKEFEHDIKLRIAIIQNKERLDELTAIKDEYTQLMDKEDRKALLDARLRKFAGTIAE